MTSLKEFEHLVEHKWAKSFQQQLYGKWNMDYEQEYRQRYGHEIKRLVCERDEARNEVSRLQAMLHRAHSTPSQKMEADLGKVRACLGDALFFQICDGKITDLPKPLVDAICVVRR